MSDLSLRGKESHISKNRRSNLKPEDQRAGAIGNISRSDENTRSLMDRIKQHPDILSKSWAERATWLNQTSVLNLKKGKLREYIPWTGGSLRKPFGRAVDEIQAEADLNEIDVAEDFYRGAQGAAGVVSSSGQGDVPSASTCDSSGRSGGSGGVLVTGSGTPAHGEALPHLEELPASLTQEEVKELQYLKERFRTDPDELSDRLGIRADATVLWERLVDGNTVPADVLAQVRALLDTTRAWGRF